MKKLLHKKSFWMVFCMLAATGFLIRTWDKNGASPKQEAVPSKSATKVATTAPTHRPRPGSHPQGATPPPESPKPPLLAAQNSAPVPQITAAPTTTSTPQVVTIGKGSPPALGDGGKGAWQGSRFSGPSKEWPWSSHPDIPVAESDQRLFLELSAQFEESRRVAYEQASMKGWALRGLTAKGATFELVGVDDNGLPLYYEASNANAAISTAVTQVRDVNPYASAGSLTGSGFRVGIWDEGKVLSTHRELTGRVTIRDGSTIFSNHSTHVAGTIGASGVTASAKGMVPAVSLHSYDWNNDTAEMSAAGASSSTLGTNIVAVSNHSYGYISGWDGNEYYGRYPAREDEKFGQYSSSARSVDQVAFNRPFYLVFSAAGNDRNDSAPSAGSTFYYNDSNGTRRSKTYVSGTDPLSDGWDNGGFDTIGGGFGSAKNIVTIGAANDAVSGGVRAPSAATISSFSGWGPADDGRIKPDLVANGVGVYSSTAAGTSAYDSYNGTSMATPNAAGTAMMLQQLYSRQFGGEIMRASMLKALLIHTATDIGRPGPDYVYGWGLINAKAAADIIMTQKTTPTANSMVEGELTTSNLDDVYSFTYSGSGPLRATISWTDVAGNTVSGLDNSTRALVNDLDIRLTGAAAGSPYVLSRTSPANNATTGDNIVDNVEQIYLASPAAGSYSLRVSYKGSLSGGRQRYSLVISGQSMGSTTGPVIALAPGSLAPSTTQGGASPAGQSFTIRNSGTGTLNYTISDNASWMTVSPTSGSSTGESDTINVTYNTSGLGAGVYQGQITVQSSSGGTATLPVELTISATTVTLASALDLTSAPANYGSLPWIGQTAITRDGIDAGRSGAITHSQESGFTMNVTGPGRITYYAKVDSESGYDYLKFDVDGVTQEQISGAVDWTAKQFTIAAGTHTLRWRYTKDGSLSGGLDAAFVDQVLYVQTNPEIQFIPDRALVVSTTQGVNASSQSFSLRNSGLGTLNYTISDNATWMSVSPTSGSSTGETDSITVNFSTTSLAAGTYNGTITVAGGSGVLSKTLAVQLVVNPTASVVTFANAVDYSTATWSQTANSTTAWIGQTVVSKDGIDAGKSGAITHNQSSRVGTTLTGPGTFSYWWKVDSESNWDYLELWMDGVYQRSISGAVDWTQVTAAIASGIHSIEFRYVKDGSINAGADAGWVDMFTFTGTRPPQPIATPASLAARGEEAAPLPTMTAFTLTNAGGASYNYSITDSASWLTVSPSSGTVDTDSDEITLACNTSGLRAGTYSASVRVDCGSAGVLIVPVSLQVTSVNAVPVSPTVATAYNQPFTSSAPPTAAQGWTYYSTTEGRIRIVNGLLRMDDSVDEGEYSLNEAVLHANLLGKTGVTLRFKHREYSDENHDLPASFTGHSNGDGVCISANGTTWYRIDTLSGATSTLTQTTVALDSVIASLGISYTTDFLIKFQQYDNYPVSSDGFEFDDISLSVTGVSSDDHGGTLATATPVILGATTNGRIETSGDQDFFKLVLPSATKLMVFTTGATDTVGAIYNSVGTLITSNDDYDISSLGFNFFLSTDLPAGTYYISTRGYGTTTGSYVLNLHDGGNDTGRPELPATIWNYATLTDFNPFEADWILYPFEGLVYSLYTNPGNPTELMTFDGELSLSFTGSSYTGTLRYREASYSVRGSFDRSTGQSTATIPRTGNTPIVLNLEFKQTANTPTLSIAGSIGINGTVSYVVLSERLGYAPRAGRYTFLIPADDSADPLNLPGGDGYATMVMGTGGNFTMTGRLADGASFTESGYVTTEGEFYLHRSVYPGGWIAGDLKFRYLPGVSDADGEIEWRKPVRPSDPSYRNGIYTWRPMLGSSYIEPTSGAAHVLPGMPLGPTGATANFGSGAFFPPLGLHAINFGTSDSVSYSGPAGLSMRVNRTDGTFSGSIRQPYTNRTFPFYGVTFQRQGIMSGYVVGPNPYYYSTGFISVE